MRGKRVCGPRRVVMLAKGVFDEAVDLEKSNLEQYWPSMFDPKHLVFVTGEQPSWFTIHPLAAAQLRAEPEGTEIEVNTYRVLCGLSKIENFNLVTDDGQETAAPQPDRKERGMMGFRATEKWLNESGLCTDDINGLGEMIRHLSEPQLPFSSLCAKPSGPSGKSET